MTRTICVFTATRAEYGLLRPLLRQVQSHPDFSLRLLVSGTHLRAAFGNTRQEILHDGFHIDAEVDILSEENDAQAQCRAMALGIEGFGRELLEMRPDLLVLLGDRYEALAAAIAATTHRIPIAHLHGGERSEGVLDEQFRHAITKLSHLHFAAAEAYCRRIVQLGEQPARVFNVGAIGLDNIRNMDAMPDEELRTFVGFLPDESTLLATLHPEADGRTPAATLAERMLRALDELPDTKVILTKANADPGGKVINTALERYAAQADPARVRLFSSMGQRAYLSAMRRCGAVVGNSSSGIIEAPCSGVPSVNIGVRQHGRLRADSIIDCDADTGSITTAIRQSLTPAFRQQAARTATPYGSGNTAPSIVRILETTDFDSLLDKPFHDLEQA